MSFTTNFTWLCNIQRQKMSAVSWPAMLASPQRSPAMFVMTKCSRACAPWGGILFRSTVLLFLFADWSQWQADRRPFWKSTSCVLVSRRGECAGVGGTSQNLRHRRLGGWDGPKGTWPEMCSFAFAMYIRWRNISSHGSQNGSKIKAASNLKLFETEETFNFFRASQIHGLQKLAFSRLDYPSVNTWLGQNREPIRTSWLSIKVISERLCFAQYYCLNLLFWQSSNASSNACDSI